MNNPPQLIVTAEMDEVRVTGVQTHFTDFMDYLREQEREVEFVGRIEAIQKHLPRRLFIGLLRRTIPMNSEFAYSRMRWLSYRATRAELKRRIAGLSEWRIYAQDPVTALAAVSLRKNPGQRVTLGIHYNISQAEEMADRGLLKRNSRLYRRIIREEQEAIHAVDSVVVYSRFMHEQLKRQGAAARHIVIIPNTAQIPIAAGTEPRDLIAIGSLEPRKNQQFILRVLAEAKRRGYCYSLDLVGTGEDLKRLMSLTEALGIADQVHFLGWRHAAPLLHAHRLLVHSALMENLPVTLIESLAAGVPILAAPVGGIPEVFDDGVEGRFWDLENIEDAASILIGMMEDKGKLNAIAIAARERYARQFERKSVFATLTKVVYGID